MENEKKKRKNKKKKNKQIRTSEDETAVSESTSMEDNHMRNGQNDHNSISDAVDHSQSHQHTGEIKDVCLSLNSIIMFCLSIRWGWFDSSAHC